MAVYRVDYLTDMNFNQLDIAPIAKTFYNAVEDRKDQPVC
jgi:hypothetical protein